jgi:hypothetical protein
MDWITKLVGGAAELQVCEQRGDGAEPTGPDLVQAVISVDHAERERAKFREKLRDEQERLKADTIMQRAADEFAYESELLAHVAGSMDRLAQRSPLDHAVAGWKGFAGVVGAGLAVDRGASALGADRSTRAALGSLFVGAGAMAAIAMGRGQDESSLDSLAREQILVRHRARQARST